MFPDTVLIEISGLEHTYRPESAQPVRALRRLDLSIGRGEYIALVGSNGSGKTTLARHLNGLLRPTHGRVLVAGCDTRHPADLAAIRSQIGMVFQRPEDQIIATTVADDVAFGPENLNLSGPEIQERVRWALDKVKMWEWRDHSPHHLSAGQQQRVAIAGALAMKPQCLVLDEATAMLDPAGRRELLALLDTLHAEGITLLHITHHMVEAARPERVIALAEGQVAYDGPPKAFFAAAGRLAALGLAAPPLVQVAQTLSNRWDFVPAEATTEEELASALAPHLRHGKAPSPRAQDNPARPPRAEQILVDELDYTYFPGSPLEVTALRQVTLRVAAGESVALLGATGSGKSTLLQMMAGLLEPTRGSIRRVPAGVGGPHRKTVGLLLQRPEEQLFETFVGDDVAFGPRQLGMEQEQVRERVRWAMDLVGLPFAAHKDRFCTALSGGEQRKAALAGVLALQPQVLLLDEPTAGLDPRSRRELLATLRRWQAENGATLVLATHDLDETAAWVDRAVVLDGGRIVQDSTPRQLFDAPDLLHACGLEAPAIPRLMNRLRTLGAAVPAGVLTVPEALAALEAMLLKRVYA